MSLRSGKTRGIGKVGREVPSYLRKKKRKGKSKERWKIAQAARMEEKWTGRNRKRGRDDKTRSAEGRTAKKGRIDKASWNFFNPSPPLGEETTAIGQRMKLDKFNTAARRLLPLRWNRWLGQFTVEFTHSSELLLMNFA